MFGVSFVIICASVVGQFGAKCFIIFGAFCSMVFAEPVHLVI